MPTERAIAGLVALLGILWASTAAGGTVAWQLSGTIDVVSDTLVPGSYGDGAQAIMDADLAAAGIAVGAPWSLRIRFEPDAAGTEIEPGLVQFSAAGARFDLSVGAFAASSGTGTSGEADLLGEPIGNALAFLAPVSSASPDVFADSGKLVLVALLGGTFPADSLPADPPDLAGLAPAGALDPRGELTGTHFTLSGYVLVPPSATGAIFNPDDVPAGFTISGSVAEIERVPEPPAPALATAGLALLTWAASRPRSARAGAAARPGS